MDDYSVQELVAVIDRTKKALWEGGDPGLAERCHIIVEADGNVCLSFDRITRGVKQSSLALKALSLDPEVEAVPEGVK